MQNEENINNINNKDWPKPVLFIVYRDVYGAEEKRTFLASPKTFTFGTFGKPKIAVLAVKMVKTVIKKSK